MSFVPLETIICQKSSDVCAPFVGRGQLKLSVAIWLPSGSVCTNSSHSASRGGVRTPMVSLMLKTLTGNTILSTLERNSSQQSHIPWHFCGRVSGVCLNFKVLKKITQHLTHTHTYTQSVDPALGSLPPMVQFRGEKKINLTLRTAGFCEGSGFRLSSGLKEISWQIRGWTEADRGNSRLNTYCTQKPEQIFIPYFSFETMIHSLESSQKIHLKHTKNWKCYSHFSSTSHFSSQHIWWGPIS